MPENEKKAPTPADMVRSLSVLEGEVQTLRRAIREGEFGAKEEKRKPAHEDEAAAKKRTKAQTPAPKKDRVKGSSKNPKGSAAGGKKITFSKKVEAGLRKKGRNPQQDCI